MAAPRHQGCSVIHAFRANARCCALNTPPPHRLVFAESTHPPPPNGIAPSQRPADMADAAFGAVGRRVFTHLSFFRATFALRGTADSNTGVAVVNETIR